MDRLALRPLNRCLVVWCSRHKMSDSGERNKALWVKQVFLTGWCDGLRQHSMKEEETQWLGSCRWLNKVARFSCFSPGLFWGFPTQCLCLYGFPFLVWASPQVTLPFCSSTCSPATGELAVHFAQGRLWIHLYLEPWYTAESYFGIACAPVFSK